MTLRRFLIALASAPLVLSAAAHASRFEDLGPALGLPAGTPGASTGKSLVAAISAADLDGDGDVDLVATEPLRGLVIYLRDGALFRAAPEWVDGLQADVYGHTLFDMDGDGDLDLYLARTAGDRLFANQGDKLVDVTAARLPAHPGWAFTATAVDLDGDRDLDLLVARYIDRPEFPAHRCLDNLVLDNDGHGRFTDISAASGLRDTRGCSFVTLAFDLDADHDLDLFTVNDFSQFTGPNELWRNVGRDAAGHPQFVEVARSLGFDARVYGMGLAIGDLDQNGRLDFFVTNIGEPLLYELGPDGRFVDVGAARGLRVRYAADRNNVTWSARAIDLDSDGYLDLLAASGELSAADFIGNGPDLQSLWLRGRPDGTLVAQPREQAFDVPGGTTRDFALVDVDGDLRPEIVAIHMHGGISVLRDKLSPPVATALSLRPVMTAPGAAGAEVTLSCGGLTRTRVVVAGGDYGNADLGEVNVAFPAPCEGPGHPLSGQVRWPSGYVQAIAATSGQPHSIVEDNWLTLIGDVLTVDLGAHLESFTTLAPVGHGVTLGAVEAIGVRQWRWPLTRDPATPEATLTLALDDQPMGLVGRLGAPPVALWLDPASPTAGHALTVYARFASAPEAAAVSLGDEVEVALEAFDGDVLRAVLVPSTEGLDELVITSESLRQVMPIVVHDPVSDERSELVARGLHVLAGEVANERVRLRLRLRDENNLPSDIPIDQLAVKIDGTLYEPVERAYDADLQTLVIDHRVLHHGARLQVVVRGRDRFPEQEVLQLESSSDLGRWVVAGSPGARSFCALSEPRLVADGVDRGTVMVQLFDAHGARLPDLGNPLLFDTDGVTVLTREIQSGYGGWTVPVRAGSVAKVGRLSARVAGQAVAVSCPIVLMPPRPLAPVAPGSPLVPVFGAPRLDEAATLRFVPRGEDGLALGSGVPFHFEIAGAEVEPITIDGASTYVGLGRYELDVTPRLAGPLVVSAIGDDARLLAARTWHIGTPAAEAEEADPEVSEAGPELVELAESGPEAVEVETEVIEIEVVDTGTADLGEVVDSDMSAAAEAEDTASDASSEVADTHVDDSVVGSDDIADAGDPTPDPDSGVPDATEPETEPAADTSPDDAVDPSPRSPRDDGCASDPALSPLGLAAALLLALRRRHKRA